MKFLTDKTPIPWDKKGTLGGWLLEFSFEKDDYYLNYRMAWKQVSGILYHFRIGNDELVIPSNFFVMIADVFGELDWIQSDELVSREADILLLDEQQHNWTLRPAEFVRESEGIIYWPTSKNLIPMLTGKNVVVFSEKDVYTKMVDMTISNMIV